LSLLSESTRAARRERFGSFQTKTLAFISLLLPGLLVPAAARPLLAQVNVPTWRYDNTHQGQNTQETILTPTNVNTNTFGKLFSHTVDGQVYAQPLYVANLTVNGATHNVIFIADQHDSVYAFDADSNGGANSGPLWQASMISTAHGAASGATTVPTADVQGGVGDINPEIGISGTPVIDLTTNTLFVVAKSKENGNYVQRLHALNILTGNEQSGSPVAISASVPGNGNASSGGTLTFSTLWQHNRVALGLFNGNIYMGFGSHGDDGPWHGWVLVYNETTLKQTAAICTSPNGNGDGIWGSGAGFPIDTVSANGRAFLATGNGDMTTYPPLTSNVDYGDSILRYDLSNGGFAISDAFTVFNQASLSGADLDQGSGGVLMLPDQPGPYPHLLLQVGKEGRILILNRDSLGGYVGSSAGSNTNAVQDITGALGSDSGLWSTPAYWNGNVYMWAENDALKMFPITNGVLAKKATSESSATSSFPGASPVVSSSGTQNGIVWALMTDLYLSNGSSVLYAFNATNVAQELYASNQNSSRDNAGTAIKFTVPVVTNGKVYVGAGGQVDVYGLLNAEQQAPSPVIAPAGGTYSSAQQVTITDTVSGAAIYYTIDGSTPTASSTKYMGALQLSTDTTVQAIASASGYLQSAVSSATYNFNTQTPAPQFFPAAGTYTTTQPVTISDSTSGAVIYYTTDGSTPSTGSTKYTGPISVSSSMVINAIATFGGLTNSNLAVASYTIVPNGTGINYGSGFASVAGLTLNGSATNADDSRLQLTTGLTYQVSSVFYNTPTNIQAFTTDFAFQLSNAVADGFTFTMQNVGPTAIGGYGGSLGYGPTTGTTGGIAKSVAIKFDFYSNNGEGTDSTGLYVDGASPTVPAVDMTSSGILLNSGDSISAHMTYDGVNLIMTLTDIVVNKTFTYTFPINIASTIGSNLAYIGFTGGSGGSSSSQKILSWTFASQSGSVTQTPTFSPAGGSFPTAQQVTLSDGTTGAVIYYTVDGSVPTTSSAVYSTPISVDSGSVTIHAIAQAPSFSASSMGSATYSIQPATAATPTFSPGTGTYTSAQSVTIADTTPGTTIYYTTNGATPTTSSAVYSGAIAVSANTTLEALAVATGYAQSAVGTAAYVIQSGAPSTINFGGGFPGATGLQLNGSTKVKANNLELTDGGDYEAGSVFWTAPVNIQAFTTNFTFQLASAVADGFTFTIQDVGATALGVYGGGLGYGIDPNGGTTGGIAKSVAIKFDLYSNSGEGADSTGIFTNGAAPTNPAVSLTSSGIVLSSGDTISAQLVYNGTTLTLNLTDTVTNKTFSQVFTINIPTTVGATTAYVGFTGGTGGSSAIQNIKTWTFTSGTTTPVAADPVFNPLPGIYTSAQNVSLSSATTGATIYYTVDGSTPTHSSAVYSAPIVVNGASLTIRAFASTAGYQDSPIVVGTYQIQAATSPAATPTFSPVSGTSFSSTLSVSIADTTPSAAIHYTTDGSTPTTASQLYSVPFPMSATTTVHAIATASGYTQSALGTASYTYSPSQSITQAPAFSPAGGSFTTALQVTISDATAGAVIYYTTNGTPPTTSSAVYSSAITVSASEALEALAVAPGYAQSAVASAAYVIQSGGTSTINFASGFPSATGLQLNGAAKVNANNLELTDGGDYEAGSVFWTAPVNIQAFTTNFTFQLSSAVADGFTFTIQDVGATALGVYGGGLGYGIDPNGGTTGGIAKSVAIKFDLYSNSGEGADSTGIFTNGAAPTNPAVSLTSSGIVLSSGDTISAQLVYNGTTLTLNLTDTVTNKTFSQAFTINIPSTVGANTAYVGFTGGTGGSSAIQNIKTWTFSSGTTQATAAATPAFTPASGTSFSSTLNVSIADTTPAASIYYTTDGSTPSTASPLYSGPFAISATTTVQAIATASGYTQSILGSASYTYSPAQSVTQTPTFSPAGGSFPTAQQVTISDATAGAVIYYTIDGSVPTTSSAVYSSPISVGGGTVTIKALAMATGDSASAVASASYTIQSTTAATPTFSPAAGSFTTAQPVTISDATAGAVIYYTTNGTPPTTSSAVYSSAITVSASETLETLAVAPGYAQSAVASAAYVIQSGGTSTINFASGFPSATGLQLNGVTKVNANNLELTDGGDYEAGSTFWTTPVNIQAFTTNFTFQLSSAVADGFTFTIQDAGGTAIGVYGGGLGYGINPNGGTTGGIAKSVAIKFDIYSNSGEGSDSTGFFTDGAAPTNPAVSLTSSGIVLSSGDTIAAQLVYDGTTLTLNLTDTVTNKTFTYASTINIPSTVGANTAYVGFTGGTGGSSAIQNIKTWTFSSGTP
jgi:hypothetical protein